MTRRAAYREARRRTAAGYPHEVVEYQKHAPTCLQCGEGVEGVPRASCTCDERGRGYALRLVAN